MSGDRSVGALLHGRIVKNTRAVFATGLSVLGVTSVAAWMTYPGKTTASTVVLRPTTTTSVPANLSPLPIDSSVSQATAAAQAAASQSSQTVVVQQAPIIQAAPPAQAPAATTRVS